MGKLGKKKKLLIAASLSILNSVFEKDSYLPNKSLLKLYDPIYEAYDIITIL